MSENTHAGGTQLVDIPLVGNRVPKEITEWIRLHVSSADYDFSLDHHVTITYIGDGTPPPAHVDIGEDYYGTT